MRFVPGDVSFNGVELAFVLVTTYSYTPLMAPTVGFGHESTVTWSYVIDRQTPAHTIGLPGGVVYWFKCWTPVDAGNYHVKYVVGAPQVINGGSPIVSQQKYSEVCP